jgi:hypothetical protein
MLTKVMYLGSLRDGESVPIVEQVESWNEYRLNDGTVLRFKSVVTEIVRLTNPDVYDNEGVPIYVVKSTQMAAIAQVPENLRKKV